LTGHPHFVRLNLEIEKGEPIIYSIKASSDDGESTYVSTRFSTAQMNVAAIAIFLANYEKMISEFRCLLIDDPTQSMDPQHKKALSNVIMELAKSNQIILATEDGELVKSLTSASKEIDVKNLKDWTIKGPLVDAS
jgi:ABC-type lipoprotein export system ATPase subunit